MITTAAIAQLVHRAIIFELTGRSLGGDAAEMRSRPSKGRAGRKDGTVRQQAAT